MKRFRFPLQSVSTVRAWRERAAREAFATAVQQLAQADQALQQVRTRVVELENLLRHGQATTFRPQEHAAAVTAYQHELLNVRAAEEKRAAADSALTRARQDWQAARNQLRVINQLEQRARQAHGLAQEKDEQSALDEIATLRASRAGLVQS